MKIFALLKGRVYEDHIPSNRLELEIRLIKIERYSTPIRENLANSMPKCILKCIEINRYYLKN